MDPRCHMCGAPSDAPPFEQMRHRAKTNFVVYQDGTYTDDLHVVFTEFGVDVKFIGSDVHLYPYTLRMLRKNNGKKELRDRPALNDGRLIGDAKNLVIENMTEAHYDEFDAFGFREFGTIFMIHFRNCRVDLNHMFERLPPRTAHLSVFGGRITFDLKLSIENVKKIVSVSYADLDEMVDVLHLFLGYFPHVALAEVSNLLYLPFSARAVIKTKNNESEGIVLDDDTIRRFRGYKCLRVIRVRVESKRDIYYAMKLYIECPQLCELQGAEFYMQGPDKKLKKFLSNWIFNYRRQPTLANSADQLFAISSVYDSQAHLMEKTHEPEKVDETLFTLMNELKKTI